jgi:uncharacterized membrane protein YfcA
MDVATTLMLVAAGIVGGTISSLVGGAAIVTFPTLIAAGLSPVVATATNLVALSPGNFLAALYDRTQLPPLDRAFVGLLVWSTVGATLGAILLLLTPERMFAVFVPALLGFATVLFAYAGRISEWMRARTTARGMEGPHRWGHSRAAVLPVSVYGGYFGAGVGVLLLGVLSVGTDGDYRAANVIKNLMTSLNSVVAAIVFMVQGKVSWPAMVAMMAGALVGALIGARIAQVVPREVMRVVVVAMGALLTGAFAWRYWF